MRRSSNPWDQMIEHVDHGLKIMTGSLPVRSKFQHSDAPSATALSEAARQRSSQLMRVNHCGEVCAQGLYHGQFTTARTEKTRQQLRIAAEDEQKHLIWCQTRLKELNSHTSYLNPFWYAASWVTGAVTGLLGDKVSLGFVAATEEEVCQHLDRHLEELPEDDYRSREIVSAMKADEAHHQQDALDLGGARFPTFLKRLMALQARVMTSSTRWL